MTPVGSRCLRSAFTLLALLGIGVVSLPGLANATSPTLDIEGYSTCTATTAPGPNQHFDGVVTACCEQSAGIPTPSAYGMACVAAVENQPADNRPTIVLPTRPQSLDDATETALLGGPSDIGDPDLPIGPNDPHLGGQPVADLDSVGNPFDAGGPQ